MNTTIIPQLIKKDFLLMRKVILACSLVTLLSIVVISILYGRIPDLVLMNVGFTLLVTPPAICGFVLLMQTNVFEKEKSTQPFIMSLPITVKEFTMAKMLVNLPPFSAIWLVITGVAFYFCFRLNLVPLGAVPFITMIFLGGFVAYTCILSVSLLSQTLGITVIAIALFQIGTSAYLWIVAFLDPIANHIYGPEIVWNSTAITIVLLQIIVAVFMITATLVIQNQKRDFI